MARKVIQTNRQQCKCPPPRNLDELQLTEQMPSTPISIQESSEKIKSRQSLTKNRTDFSNNFKLQNN